MTIQEVVYHCKYSHHFDIFNINHYDKCLNDLRKQCYPICYQTVQ